MENEELSVLQGQVEQLHKDSEAQVKAISELTQSVQALVEPIAKQAKDEEEKTAKQKREEEEQKTFKRFLKMLKDGGYLQKQGDVPKAEGQETQEAKKKPAEQQAVIQGQEKKDDEEEYPEAKANDKEEYEEEKAKADEEEEEKQAKDEEDEVEKLRKENEELKAQMTSLQESLPTEVEKAVSKRMQELGWKTVSKAPVKDAAQTDVPILKGQDPIKREDMIQQLKSMPLTELNLLAEKVRAGLVEMPGVK